MTSALRSTVVIPLGVREKRATLGSGEGARVARARRLAASRAGVRGCQDLRRRAADRRDGARAVDRRARPRGLAAAAGAVGRASAAPESARCDRGGRITHLAAPVRGDRLAVSSGRVRRRSRGRAEARDLGGPGVRRAGDRAGGGRGGRRLGIRASVRQGRPRRAPSRGLSAGRSGGRVRDPTRAPRRRAQAGLDALDGRARALEALGRVEEAAAAFQELVEVAAAPSDVRVRAARQRLRG
jgi:hypothetical protein